MIPFALKQAWFWLALIGLVQCWITLVVLPGRKIGGLWGRLYYCVFVTLLEGMFCAGLIWHMDPKSMPHVFCVAQVISFSLATFALTGLCASITVASALAVFRPSMFNSGRAVLAWHLRYSPLVIFFPVAACVTQSTLLITLDAVNPSVSDDLHCDATHPIWMRLVGYAGVPLIVSIPFLLLSIFTAIRLIKITQKPRLEDIYSSVQDGDHQTQTLSHLYDPDIQKRRNQARRLTAFLPYPTKTHLKKSVPVTAVTSTAASTQREGGGEDNECPLHQHPFPPIDPLTGKAYSPSLEDRDTTPFTITAASLRAANTLGPHDQLHFAPQNLSPLERHVRRESTTPDSAFSSTMPEFASNPSLPHPKVQASATSVNFYPGRDVQFGIATTTDDSPKVEDDARMDEDVIVGLAVTTDEPDPITPTPSLRLRTSSPLKQETRASPALSETQTVQDNPHPPDSFSQHGRHPFKPDPALGLELGLGDRAKSSDSIARTLPSSQHPLHRLAHTNHSAPHAFSSPFPSVPHRPINQPHQRQASFVSSATFYSAPFPDREDRDLLPFSPASASSVQSPMTPKDMSIDLALDLGLHHQAAEHPDGDDDGKVGGTDSWEDEYIQGVERTVKSRDPRERLGIYNPTPTTPTAVMLERRRRKLQRKQHHQSMKGSTKLGSAIWRVVLFQIAFFVIQLLASLSSILDVAHNRITPFGTQHVALLLAAWGPLCIFGRVPSCCHFWTRQK